jgi:hypothetical protein
MPISKLTYKDGVIFCKQTGVVDTDDAIQWTYFVQEISDQNELPFVAIVDALDVERVSLQARTLLARASGIRGLSYAAVATTDFTAKQSARLTGALATDRHTEIFASLNEARSAAQSKLTQLRGATA